MRQQRKSTYMKKVRRTLAKFLRTSIEHPAQESDHDNMTAPVRVYGPYANGSNYRLTVIEGTARKSVCVKTLAEAERLKADLERSVADRSATTIGSALAEYLDGKRLRGDKPLTITSLESKLRLFLPVEDPLCSLTAARAQKLYDEETTRTNRFGRLQSPTTHRLTLRAAKAFFAWTLERSYLRINPFASVKPVGKVRAGKLQLRLDEARKLCDRLLERAEERDAGALALLLQLFLGLRSSEVLTRVVRDLDDDGRILCIPFGKTGNARRRLEIPEQVRALLLRHIAGKSADSLIFPSDSGRVHFTDWLRDRLHTACAQLGLPRVCPHSLRGLHSTLALEAGSTPHAVASSLGHGSFEVTARHYADPNTLRNARVRRVASSLLKPALTDLIETLRALSPQDRAVVLSAVADADPAA